jgi:hypothetical protein
LFSGEDDVFSWASVQAGQGFGLFPELRLRHLISAVRLNQSYFVRLIHDHKFSHAVLRYLLTGVPQRRIAWTRYPRLLLHGIKNGRFSMRCQMAALRGEDSAACFIEENRLHPIEAASGLSRPGASADLPQLTEETRSSTKFPCTHQK